MNLGNPRARFGLAAVWALSACSPTTIYVQKKEVDRNAPPSPAIRRDQFQYQVPSGPVDVLIATDNTDSFQDALPAFQAGYRRLVANFAGTSPSPDARLLDFRIQVTSNPSGATPGDWIARGIDPDRQLGELFDPAPTGGPMPIFSLSRARESGYPDPIAAFTQALGRKEFRDRSFVPLFLVSFSGYDAGPATSGEALSTEANAFRTALAATRGLNYQASLLTHTRLTSATSAAAHATCSAMEPAPRILDAFASIGFREVAQDNLCGSSWTAWDAVLFQKIVSFKRRLILSQIPYLPETMVLRTPSRAYRYGDDYHWSGQANEIVFDRDPGIQAGDLVEATYYLEPGNPALPGGPTPMTLPQVGR